MSKLRRFDLLRIAHLEVSEDLPQQEGLLRNLPNNLEAGIPTVPNKDPWSCEEYTLNLNHSTWGYLKYNSFTRKKARRRTAEMCLLVTRQQLFCGFFFGWPILCPKQKCRRRRSSSFSKCETNDQTSAWLTTMPLHCNSSRQGKSLGHREREAPSDSK